MKEILEILKEIRPDVEISKEMDFVKEELLDSLDLIQLVSELESNYSIEISGVDLTPENFSNLVAIENLVKKSKNES